MDAGGVPKAKIARRLRLGRSTIARYADMADMSPEPPVPADRPHPAIDPHIGWIDDLLETDLVSQRVAELLARAPFYLGTGIFKTIHRLLFQDLDPSIYRPGEFKAERLVKAEEILNGNSVPYADPFAYEDSPHMAFELETRKIV